MALRDDELLTEQGVLEQEFGPGARQIEGAAESNRGLRQLSPAEIELLQLGERAAEAPGMMPMPASAQPWDKHAFTAVSMSWPMAGL